jgi:hypothetical protein
MAEEDVHKIVSLLHERNVIDEKIAAVIQRPMTSGHLGAWIAAQVFIELEPGRHELINFFPLSVLTTSAPVAMQIRNVGDQLITPHSPTTTGKVGALSRGPHAHLAIAVRVLRKACASVLFGNTVAMLTRYLLSSRPETASFWTLRWAATSGTATNPHRGGWPTSCSASCTTC